MKKLMNGVMAFIREDEGLTTVEYAVAGSLVAAVTVAAFQALGLRVCDVIDGLTVAIGGAGGAC